MQLVGSQSVVLLDWVGSLELWVEWVPRGNKYCSMSISGYDFYNDLLMFFKEPIVLIFLCQLFYFLYISFSIFVKFATVSLYDTIPPAYGCCQLILLL